ncbi:MAG: radical SAM protein [Candidatus Kryptonium sp.]|nr:radical SAM protein [Candidatus Kryptonium sp.]
MRNLTIKIIETQRALSKSRIQGIDYTVNPYVGCEFGCLYCYADFMTKFSKNYSLYFSNCRWGEFVGVKINILEKLRSEILRLESKFDLFSNKEMSKPKIWMSIVTDPYQPVEKKFELTRKCLEILLEFQCPTGILTRSPLVVRDIDLFVGFENLEIGLTITTDNDNIRKIFEPKAPSIKSRIKTLEILKKNNVRTFAFIGPILPMNAKKLSSEIDGLVDYVLVDRMNYIWKTEGIYRRNLLEFGIRDEYFRIVAEEISSYFSSKGIEVEILF